MAIKQLVASALIGLLLSPTPFSISAVYAETPDAPPIEKSKVLIHEIKLGGASLTGGQQDPQEYITLYNQSETIIDLSNYVIEYAKLTFDKTYCSSERWLTHSNDVSETKLSGSLLPGKISTPIIRSLTDNKAGSVRLSEVVEDVRIVHDLVGWGETAPCSETLPTATPSNGKSTMRYLGCSAQLPVDSNNNHYDFAPNQKPSPYNQSEITHPGCEIKDPELPNEEEIIDDEELVVFTCEGVLINELLPNPAGADSEREFIELFNPTTDHVSMNGCIVTISTSSKRFIFTDTTQIEPKGYLLLYSKNLGMSLPNASGATLQINSAAGGSIDSVTYPGGLEDDLAWARFGIEFKHTYIPTPGFANQLLGSKPCAVGYQRVAETLPCTKIPVVKEVARVSLTPCMPTQERNPETNRCRNVLQPVSLNPCKAGQTRNLETNRCRSTTTLTSALTPCKAGQTRNPETKRCRNVLAAATNLKPCAEGQERNPDTNRCRKVVSASTKNGLAQVRDVPSEIVTKSFRWTAVGLVALAAVSYGIYEWRNDIANAITKWRGKFKILKPRR